MAGQRNTNVDLLRLLCAFGVISIHVKSNTPSASLFTDVFWAEVVSFFFIISLLYFIKGLPGQSLKNILQKIGLRIVVPLIAWTIIYSLLIFVKRSSKGVPVDFVAWRAFLYGESAVHLYFLSSLILMQVYTIGIYLLVTRKQPRAGILLLMLGIAYHVAGYLNNCFGLSAIGTFIAFPAYIVVAYCLSLNVRNNNIQKPYSYWPALALFILSVALNCYEYKLVLFNFCFITLFAGAALAVVAISSPNIRIPSWLVTVSATSYGIYLSHVLFLEAFEFILHKYWHIDLYYDFLTKFIFVSVIFVTSIFFTLFVKRIPVVNALLLGARK